MKGRVIMEKNNVVESIENEANELTEVYELNERYFVYGQTKDFESVEHFIEVATKEQTDEDTYIGDVRTEKCVIALDGLPSCELRPVSEALLEYYDCYVAELKQKRSPLALEYGENHRTEEFRSRAALGEKTARDIAGQYLYHYPHDPLGTFQFHCQELDEDLFNEISKLIQDDIINFRK